MGGGLQSAASQSVSEAAASPPGLEAAAPAPAQPADGWVQLPQSEWEEACDTWAFLSPEKKAWQEEEGEG